MNSNNKVVKLLSEVKKVSLKSKSTLKQSKVDKENTGVKTDE